MQHVYNIYKHPPYRTVYIGRPGKGHNGEYGNPCALNRVCPICSQVHTVPKSTIPCYRIWFAREINNNIKFKLQVLALKGKDLGCFCAPEDGLTSKDPVVCHGQVILEWLESQ